MRAMPTEPVAHCERLLQERDDADAVRISEEVKAGREHVFTHDEVWREEFESPARPAPPRS
ncbi:hypothetical protein GCM10026982_37170 [Nocardiopsis aegyptia]